MREELKSFTMGRGVQSATMTGSRKMHKLHADHLVSMEQCGLSEMPIMVAAQEECGWTMWSVLVQRLALQTALTFLLELSTQTVQTTQMMLELCVLMVGTLYVYMYAKAYSLLYSR